MAGLASYAFSELTMLDDTPPLAPPELRPCTPGARAADDGSWVVCDPSPDHGADADDDEVAVAIAPNGRDYVGGRDPLAFLLYGDPDVELLLPSGGPTRGGTTVKVTGAHLAPGATDTREADAVDAIILHSACGCDARGVVTSHYPCALQRSSAATRFRARFRER